MGTRIIESLLYANNTQIYIVDENTREVSADLSIRLKSNINGWLAIKRK